jgi:hypothetical protein
MKHAALQFGVSGWNICKMTTNYKSPMSHVRETPSPPVYVGGEKDPSGLGAFFGGSFI